MDYRRKLVTRQQLSFFQEIDKKQNQVESMMMLTPQEQQKCLQIFTVNNMSSSQKLNKMQLIRLMKEIGQQISEEDASQMMLKADPKNNGYIYRGDFLKIIQQKKCQKYEKSISYLGLSYDYILTIQKQQPQYNQNNTKQQLNWQFVKTYFYDNFDLDLNLTKFKGSKTLNRGKTINRRQFMQLFS